MLNNIANRDHKRIDGLRGILISRHYNALRYLSRQAQHLIETLAIANQDLRARCGEHHDIPQARSLLTALNLRETAMQCMRWK